MNEQEKISNDELLQEASDLVVDLMLSFVVKDKAPGGKIVAARARYFLKKIGRELQSP
jgi:hypothetical protein